MANAFQSGQQFEQRQFIGEQGIQATARREKGINALADLFGEQFLAPTAATAATGVAQRGQVIDANAEQRRITNLQKDEAIQQANEDRERTNAVGAARNVVGLLKLNTKNGVPIEQTIQQVGPALDALGVPPEVQEQILQGIQGKDPLGFLQSLEGALAPQQQRTGSQARPTPGVDVAGNPIFFSTDENGDPVIISGVAPPPRSTAPQEANVLRERTLIKSQLENTRKVLKGNLLATEAGRTVIRDAETALTLAAKNPLFGGRAGKTSTEGELDDDSFFKATKRFISGNIFAADTREINKLVDSIKANVGIDSLLKIKASGAGLGQVPQSQLEVLESLLGNLDPTRRPEFFLRDLREISQLYTTLNIELKEDSRRQNVRQKELISRRKELEGRSTPPEGAELGIEDLLNKFAPQEQQ